jgi:hypothetical protein
MNLVIVDLVSPNFNEIEISNLNGDNIVVLALTPSAFYFLEKYNIDYISFHDLSSTKEFQKKILNIYSNVAEKYLKDIYFDGFFRDIAQWLNNYYYIDIIVDYIKGNDFNYIYFMTDRKKIKEEDYSLNNKYSLLFNYIEFTKVFTISRKSLNYIIPVPFFKRYSFFMILKKITNKLLRKDVKYDWSLLNLKINYKDIRVDKSIVTIDIGDSYFKYIQLLDIKFNIIKQNILISPYQTFLTKRIYPYILEYKKKYKYLYFFQHGSYLYKNIFIKYSEIKLANINFVFNDYTKKLFEDLGAKEVYSVGSIMFNKPIKDRKKKYDFLYIIQAHDYSGNLQYVDFPNSLHSFDGYELYQRHKNIIKLFGTNFKDKKIVIRVHPLVVTTGVYVPFWELAENYPNITIDVSIPIHTLIEKSKYIISDYFSSEFINREIHYKRDIILFQGVPTPLPKETIEDMEKMFILVDTIDDLEDKVRNIETITKNRKRYDDIIEYYSSKKCDTKKLVLEILKKELNGTESKKEI